MLGLRWSEVDLNAATIRIVRTLAVTTAGPEITEPKSATSRRTIPIGAAAAEALRLHRRAQAKERLSVGTAWADRELVFTNEVGEPLDGRSITRTRLYPLLARAGVPRVRFHDLRHTAATLLLEAGTNPRVVAERLGHANPALVLNTYGHVTPRMQEAATAILDRVLGA